MELTKMKEEAENLADEAHYSGADDALDAVTRSSEVIARMQVAKRTKVTLEDKTLVQDFNKEKAMEDMTDVVKAEGSRVMNSISMKVLNNFWRYYTTNDAETQTYDKAIDVLKETVEKLKNNNKEYRDKLAELQAEKAKLESTLHSERAAMQRADRFIKEREHVIKEREEQILEL